MRRPSSTKRSRRSPRRPEPADSRALQIARRLQAFYGALPAPPPTAFGLYVWEVLSVGTTPTRRQAAFTALKRIPALTPDAIAKLPQARLEAAVAQAGQMRDERVRALRAGADLFRRRPDLADEIGGGFRRGLKAARRMPHLGRAAALRVLLFASDTPVLPIDEHALRVLLRLGYGPDDGHPVRALRTARRALMAETGRDLAALRAISQLLTHHGLATCTPSAPHCSVCPLAADCEWLRRQ